MFFNSGHIFCVLTMTVRGPIDIKVQCKIAVVCGKVLFSAMSVCWGSHITCSNLLTHGSSTDHGPDPGPLPHQMNPFNCVHLKNLPMCTDLTYIVKRSVGLRLKDFVLNVNILTT